MAHRRNSPWALVNRRPGQSADAWIRANAEAHRSAAIDAKIASGTWLSPEEYTQRTGRPGARLTLGQQAREAEALAGADMPRPESIAVSTESAIATPSIFQKHGEAASKAAIITAGVTFATELLRERDLTTATTRALIAGGATATRSLAVAAVKEGLEAAATRVIVAQGVKVAAPAVIKVGAMSVARGVARSNAVGQIAALLVDQSIDTVQLCRGKIDGGEYGRRSAGNVGGAAGGAAGAAAGAAIGSVVPIVGTAAGAVIGGILGSLGLGQALRRMVS